MFSNYVGFAIFLFALLIRFTNAFNIDFYNFLLEINDNRMVIERNNLLISDVDSTKSFNFKLSQDFESLVNDLIVIDNDKDEKSILPYSYDKDTNSIDIDVSDTNGNEIDLNIIIQYSHKLINLKNSVMKDLSDDKQFATISVPKVPQSEYYIHKFESTFINNVSGNNRVLEFGEDEDSYTQNDNQTGYTLKSSIEHIQPLDTAEVVNVSFKITTPMLTAKKAIRNVHLSHWSNTIQFDEHYVIENEVPQLENTFKRKEYMKYQNKNYGQSGLALSQIDAIIPADSFDHYYKDDLGMITTMKTLHNSRTKSDTMVLKPRYPILGKWKFVFNIGWFNKLEQFSHYLAGTSTEDSKEYLLEIPVIDGASNVIYENLDINIILPEGVVVKSIYTPDLNDLPGDFKKPQIEMSKYENLFDYSEEKSSEIKISYSEMNINSNLIKIPNSDNKIFIRYEINNYAVYYQKVIRLSMWIFAGIISLYFLGMINESLQK
ncbi:uncharacterized protein HGUI_00414 [Hanseniaspora guilliermondii]|uniref:Dolichyl-diphosphooligosaccharide--protein glycosyltransferase subunit 1 n=1 Tax=Hanseniaspora guilliermondii TaxID=56406 RepID=A0A1L0FF59_9ASCO|nr:uncharacterized protein HGUI_00414 [Hanseniaspora guilliermondii]